MRRPGQKPERDRENVNPQFQRIFTGILVAVAIILVAAVLFVGAQVIGCLEEEPVLPEKRQ